MPTYLVHRCGVAAGANALDAALMRLRACEETAAALPARWFHSFVLREADSRFGLLCVFQADGVPALRRHAETAGLPADDIVPIVGTLALRPFPPQRVHLSRRRDVGGIDFEQQLAETQRRADVETACQVSWLHSHLLREPGGRLGSACFFGAADAQAVADHAARVGLPAGEITPVLGRIVYRDDGPDAHPASAAWVSTL
jgi:hypothetical protein